MIDINGWEFILLIVLAVVILGPERLPEYAAKLARFVRQAKQLAERAKTQLKDEMGPEFSDIDWRAYDPRQYDPRRIVREALTAPDPAPDGQTATAPAEHDPGRPTPWDDEAT
ncbi:MAG: preprotein translocase subunit TatA [Intrasporangium sp.]|uniref:preprotein translocase subunit TatA n=1 Tax=Intrasporangium sp. TaxID=1925024 RepID=UPI0026493F93|nr:preprotein translocase subunit TatA [Intrasporangium sp.]MDN5795082.1 preprotein translocase subunit TatA [Intrasporangium sp.]